MLFLRRAVLERKIINCTLSRPLALKPIQLPFPHPSGISSGDAALTPLRSTEGDDPREWSHSLTHARPHSLFPIHDIP